MRAENLDEQLEPIAHALILIIVLLTVAAISFFVINKAAQRSKERAHHKLSGSRRTKHTQVDLFGGSRKADGGSGDYRGKHTRRRRSSSHQPSIDILARPKDSGEQAPKEGPSDGGPAG